MPKKTLLFIIFSIAFVLFPIAKVDATQVYVGVKIDKTIAPGCTPGTSDCSSTSPATDNYWCLPAGSESYQSTQMAVTKSDACTYTNSNYAASDMCYYCINYAGIPDYCLPAVSPSSNPVVTTSPTCVGGNTIWSGLLDLTNNADYQIYLYTPNFCPGYLNGYCWVSDTVNENCCDVCSHYGLTAAGGESDCINSSDCYNNYYYDDNNCTTEAKLMGSACSSCTTGASYAYYSSTDKSCYTTYDSYNYYGSCSTALSGYNRVCACNYANTATGFLFSFTASF